MNILERLNTLEERIEYYEDLIARIDNTLDEPFKYSRKKTTAKNNEITKLKEIIGITDSRANNHDTSVLRTM